jgi:hypothetical protein
MKVAMPRLTSLRPIAALALAAACTVAAAADHVAIKRAFNLPPSVDLSYQIKARQKGFSINGDAQVSWRVADGKYTLHTDSRAVILGSLLENRSEGAIDAYGVAPAIFHEKRFRKDATTTTFDRAGRTISFSESKVTYPILGGEQDRTSVPWQLVAVARAAPEKFVVGSEWSFFVAGRRDADPWTFKVVKQESLRTALGEVATVHVVKLPPADAKGQQIDIWLAPSMEWFPVRLRFEDGEGEFVDQTIDKITRK